MNFMQWISTALVAPILHLYSVKADKSALDKKADTSMVEEMSKTLHSMDEKLDAITVALMRKQ